jgi:hypothetical protein
MENEHAPVQTGARNAVRGCRWCGGFNCDSDGEGAEWEFFVHEHPVPCDRCKGAGCETCQGSGILFGSPAFPGATL